MDADGGVEAEAAAGLPVEPVGDGVVVEAAASLEEAEHAALQRVLEAVDVVGSEVRRLVEGDAAIVVYTPGGVPQTSGGGYTHIVDFTDPMNPKKVARYHLEDYPSHDIIVEDDVLYQAYYDGGVRIVDVSGMLLGNLADQGREIAVFKPFDPPGFTPNAPFVMNAMPWKGHIFFTDFNSGLWAAKLEPRVTF